MHPGGAVQTVVTAQGLAGARAAARAVCSRERAAAERCDDLQVVLSELVGNACRHGCPPVTYDVTPDAGDLLVTVEDCDPSPPPSPRGAVADGAERGRGLQIVAALARSWGWQPTGDGKVVWARL